MIFFIQEIILKYINEDFYEKKPWVVRNRET